MDYNNKRSMILKGNMARVILTLAAPIMINNSIQTIYNLADTYWVSRIGDTQIAAITLVWPIIFLMISIGIGISIAGTAIISQYIGAGLLRKAENVAGQVISISFIVSAVIGFTSAYFASYIVSAIGGTGELLSEATSYLRVIFIGLPMMFLFFSFTTIKQGQGDTLTPMKYGALSLLLNIILDPIFIFVFGLGVKGAAIATVLSRGLFAVYAIYKLFVNEDNNSISINWKLLKPNVIDSKKLLSVAVPSSVGQATEAFGFTILTMFVLSFGESTVAAFGITNRINSLILMPAMGIGTALATIIGQNIGADNIKRAKQAVRTSALLSTVFLVTGGIIIFLSADTLIGFFTTNKEVLSQGTYFLKLITLALPLMGFYRVFIGTFQGSGHTVLSMMLMTARLWVFRIPLVIILKNTTNLQEKSIWFAMIISNVLICMISFGMYLTGRWQNKVIKDSKLKDKVSIGEV
ncbi:MAG TPA: MATE family efflux transporter [Clostridiales bacterium]|nr:MATE family efflux transporter [Clostridiales bacterium]